jgi:hypothetical protein
VRNDDAGVREHLERSTSIIGRLAFFIVAPPSKISRDSSGIPDASACIRPSHDHGRRWSSSFVTMDSRTRDDAVIIVGVRKAGRCMRADASRIFETGLRVGTFTDANPPTEDDEGYTLLVGRSKDVTEQMRAVAMAQRTGRLNKTAGARDKASLRLEILKGPVAALSAVAKRARKDNRDVAMQFRYKPGAQTYVAFEGVFRAMQSAAETNKKLLVRYGLSEAVLVELGALLDRFAKARELCDQGRVAHKAATQQLDGLAQELGSVIRTMDAGNRLRYKDDRQLLEQWIAASTVLGKRGPGESVEPAEPVQEVRPAA